MRLYSPILVLLLSASLVTAEEKKAEATTFSSADHKCEIQFPGKPKETVGKDMGQALLEVMGGKAVFLLQINRFPTAIATDNEEVVNKVMDGGRDTLAKTFKTKVGSEKKLVFDKKYPARDIEMEVSGVGTYRVRFILTPTHFYQVTMAGPKEFVESAECKKFLASFTLKK